MPKLITVSKTPKIDPSTHKLNKIREDVTKAKSIKDVSIVIEQILEHLGAEPK